MFLRNHKLVFLLLIFIQVSVFSVQAFSEKIVIDNFENMNNNESLTVLVRINGGEKTILRLLSSPQNIGKFNLIQQSPYAGWMVINATKHFLTNLSTDPDVSDIEEIQYGGGTNPIRLSPAAENMLKIPDKIESLHSHFLQIIMLVILLFLFSISLLKIMRKK